MLNSIIEKIAVKFLSWNLAAYLKRKLRLTKVVDMTSTRIQIRRGTAAFVWKSAVPIASRAVLYLSIPGIMLHLVRQLSQ